MHRVPCTLTLLLQIQTIYHQYGLHTHTHAHAFLYDIVVYAVAYMGHDIVFLSHPPIFHFPF